MAGVLRANNDLYDLQTSRGQNLKCSQNGSLGINVAVGRALVVGHMVQSDAVYGITLDSTPAANPRKDRIVAYANFSTNTFGIKAVTGTAAASPQAPDLVRTSTEYQVSLAIVSVSAVPAITAVTDAREYVVLGPPPMSIVRRKTTFALANTTVTPVRFGEATSNNEQGVDYWNTTTTPVRDPDSMHSSTGSDSNDTDARLTCVVPGWYEVWGVTRYASNATGERVTAIVKVSTAGITTTEDEIRSIANTAGQTTQKVWQLVYLDIGDYVYMTAYQAVSPSASLNLEGTDALGDTAATGSRGTMFGAKWVNP